MSDPYARRSFGHVNDPHRVPMIWKSALAKAGEDDAAAYEWLHRIADAAAPDVAKRFLDAVEKVRNSIKIDELRDAIQSGSVDRVMQLLDLDRQMADALTGSITQPLEDVVIETGRAAPARIGVGGIGMRFDIVNPHVAQFVHNYDFGLIRQVSQETRDAIRAIVAQAVQFGGHPFEQAKQIRDLVGLTDRQLKAVTNYEDALQLEERDPDQVARMVARYQERMLNLRAQNIARTETLRATNAGQHLAWLQAADRGFLDRVTMRRQWLVTPDDRLCPFCAVVPEMNPDGQALGVFFLTPLGPALYPPLHPQCRCTTVIDRF